MLIKLANKQDLPEGKGVIVRGPKGEEIALFRIGEKIFALENACPHQGGPLAEGEVKGATVTCPWHAWTFDLLTGACQNMPGEEARVIPLILQEEGVYLSLPELTSHREAGEE
jgi:nitrite reductase (NADH) small subunit